MKRVLTGLSIVLIIVFFIIIFINAFMSSRSQIIKYHNLYKNADYHVTDIYKEDGIQKFTATKGTIIVWVFAGNKKILNTIDTLKYPSEISNNSMDYIRKYKILIIAEASTEHEVKDALEVVN